MPLATTDLIAIERWTGALTEDQVAQAETRLLDLRYPAIVAYEILMGRYAKQVRQPEEIRIEGDVRVRWPDGRKAAAEWLRVCYDFVRAQGYHLNAAAEELLRSGPGVPGAKRIRTIRYTSPNPRP